MDEIIKKMDSTTTTDVLLIEAFKLDGLLYMPSDTTIDTAFCDAIVNGKNHTLYLLINKN